MEILDIMTLIVIGTFIIVLGLFGIKILLKLGRTGITIIFNMILGIIFLFVVNLLPIVKIPINLLTVLVAGFGGIIGVGVLVIAKSMGLY
ncbi:MAG: pro-sigmaK processing inhibitor BofA family protein [Methanobacteriaceae archaeon]|nr:pro-sigmaK processing inhibitor BofA family protein [Methanobacteriaceae archaeon]MDP3623084.1 pro-sigmaK processing inhibitor BofA family protein [Methanobacteriaceae archaeon]